MCPKGIRLGSEKGFTMSIFIVCTVHLIPGIARVIKSRRSRWSGHKIARIVTGNTIGKRPLGRPGHR